MAETNPWTGIGSAVLYDMIDKSRDNGGHIETDVNRYINHGPPNIFRLNLHDIDKNGGGFYFHFEIYDTRFGVVVNNIDIHVSLHNQPLHGQENNQYHISITNKDTHNRRNIHLLIQKVNEDVITSIDVVASVNSLVQNIFSERPQDVQNNIKHIIEQFVPLFMTRLITGYHRLALDNDYKFGIYTHEHQKGILRQQSISGDPETLINHSNITNFYNKYLKYKQKYLELKKQLNL